MEDIAKALRELAESNNKLIEKLDELKQEKMKDREHKKRRAEEIARKYAEMDITFIEKWYGWERQQAIEQLERYHYDVAKAIRNGPHFSKDDWKERVMLHYDSKRNREIIEKW